MADPRKFLFSSDYPTPAFVGAWQGSITVPGYEYKDTTIAHGLPFMPLIIGQWSLNKEFQPSFDIGTTNGWFVGVQFNQAVGANESQIKFYLTNDYSNSQTYYYRIFAFAPSDFDGNVPSIEDATNFRFNSDFRYPKLFAYGAEDITKTDDIEVYHNLGFVPQCRVWKYDQYQKMLTPTVNLHYQDGSYTAGQYVDISKLTITGNIPGDKVVYHLYAEEAG